ncbi:serine carboxypeptidase-like 8 [Eucalyptus grandis]|uniref:serine carboxypeptidase-like 8 n=1 Tax=Eucalyptus grandis TaxID=71139 RepID=UPI00192EA30C|nr:serine carboxypeptidase-like 8 [Eucalyptus grandis]
MFHLLLPLLLLISNVRRSQSAIIESLPGFPGDLPFKLETGYVGVGELEEVQLFYYFIESERSPNDDPLLLWLTGGPGCSALSGLLFEIGPLQFDYSNSSGIRPLFELNPYSWTKIANIIFLDAPVGTGFSYAMTWAAYNINDTSSAAQTYGTVLTVQERGKTGPATSNLAINTARNSNEELHEAIKNGLDHTVERDSMLITCFATMLDRLITCRPPLALNLLSDSSSLLNATPASPPSPLRSTSSSSTPDRAGFSAPKFPPSAASLPPLPLPSLDPAPPPRSVSELHRRITGAAARAKGELEQLQIELQLELALENVSMHAHEFLRKWLLAHPKFLTNQLYITGDSYSGVVVPIIVKEIYDGNEAGREPPMNLKGYVLGNPVTCEVKDISQRIPYGYKTALISDELYESTKTDCNGDYMNVDPTNGACLRDLEMVSICLEKINLHQILEPKCSALSPNHTRLKWSRSILKENIIDVISMPQQSKPWCRSYNYLYSYIWANDRNVQEALHIREGMKPEWNRCNESISYTKDILNSVVYHRYLSKTSLRALIYSGDHDMGIPYVGTLDWIRSLNLTLLGPWGPWYVDGQVAG